ncbi:XRE family transcriptional regulator [Streptomyces sp. B1866]|uniref:XRE family transcriptional regulator n=1 Tax=Streptomyces sp. B1866 TaxID=3075431 RepID=UPI00288F4E88|nr:XRE family transcriptional regulator [Streptomyces sp. B1866]MDT3397522.1 XRE family transcriptional regulator [Streptomyces sp. B1866]
MLDRDDVRQAIFDQDFGRLFFLVRKWAGISLSRIAEACDIKSSRVYELARGEGSITSLVKIEQIADALRIPGHLLRLAPRSWESTAGYGGLPSGPDPHGLPVLNAAGGDAYAEAIRATSRRLVVLDNELNGLPVATMAARAFRSVHRRLGQGDYEPRYERDIRAAAAELAEVAGWALFDAEKQDAARRFNQEALFLARVSGDRSIELLILQNIAMQSGYLRRPREELAIARSVLEESSLSPRIEAIFRTREARGLFALGHESEGNRKFDHARSLLQEGEKDGDPFWAWWIVPEEIDGHQGISLWRVGRWKDSIPLLERALNRDARARVGYQNIYSASLLVSLLEARAWKDAAEIAESIIPAVAETTSLRTLNRLVAAARSGKDLTGAPPNLRDALHSIEEAIREDPFTL